MSLITKPFADFLLCLLKPPVFKAGNHSKKCLQRTVDVNVIVSWECQEMER